MSNDVMSFQKVSLEHAPDLVLKVDRESLGLVVAHNFAFSIDKELGKVPGDLLGLLL
jgi:hypothetical protein